MTLALRPDPLRRLVAGMEGALGTIITSITLTAQCATGEMLYDGTTVTFGAARTDSTTAVLLVTLGETSAPVASASADTAHAPIDISAVPAALLAVIDEVRARTAPQDFEALLRALQPRLQRRWSDDPDLRALVSHGPRPALIVRRRATTLARFDDAVIGSTGRMTLLGG